MNSSIKPALPGVTLVCVDCVNIELALRALSRSLAACDFARALLCTSEAVPNPPPGIEIVTIEPLRSKRDYSWFMLKELRAHVATEHVLVVQWDGFVVNPAAWHPAFLDCDYIGAPWPPDLNACEVGNGGFSLRSRRLLDALAAIDMERSAVFHEDVDICVHLRPRLEGEFGIRFASTALARRFAHETTEPDGPTFGFHGPQNMARYWNDSEIEDFVSLVSRPVLKQPEVLWLARHLESAGRFDSAMRVVGAALSLQPAQPEAQEIMGRLCARERIQNYAERAEQRFFLGLLKRNLPTFFRGRTVLIIGARDNGGSPREWFDGGTVVGLDVVAGPGVDVQARPVDYGAAGGSFDVVVSCDYLEHDPDWRDTLDNALRMLKPNGLLVLAGATLGRRAHDRFSVDVDKCAYYRNLEPQALAAQVFAGPRFAAQALLVDAVRQDFLLFAVGAEADAATLAVARQLAADLSFMNQRKNLFGQY